MKTIGILGGFGPQATLDFEQRLHQVAQRLIPPDGNSGYPPLVVYYHRQPPFVMLDPYTPVMPIQPHPDLLRASQWLGTMADFLVITANGAHRIQHELEQAAGRKVLSMIEVTLDEVRRRDWRRVGVLAFVNPKAPIYTQPLGEMNVAYETIDQDLQARLNPAILSVMEGRDNLESAQVAHEAVATLRARNVDGIILGCTELPFLLGTATDASDLLNPAQLLAEAAVRHALA